MTPSNSLAGALVGLTMVCATVLAAMHVIPAETVTHLFATVTGGGLAYLQLSVRPSP